VLWNPQTFATKTYKFEHLNTAKVAILGVPILKQNLHPEKIYLKKQKVIQHRSIFKGRKNVSQFTNSEVIFTHFRTNVSTKAVRSCRDNLSPFLCDVRLDSSKAAAACASSAAEA